MYLTGETVSVRLTAADFGWVDHRYDCGYSRYSLDAPVLATVTDFDKVTGEYTVRVEKGTKFTIRDAEGSMRSRHRIVTGMFTFQVAASKMILIK